MYPHVKLTEGEGEITAFRVDVMGKKKGRLRCYTAQMVDRYDEQTGMTSMARTTAYTGTIVARMIGRGDLQAKGIFPPEQLLAGPLFDRLIDELAAVGITFEVTTTKVKTLHSA